MAKYLYSKRNKTKRNQNLANNWKLHTYKIANGEHKRHIHTNVRTFTHTERDNKRS